MSIPKPAPPKAVMAKDEPKQVRRTQKRKPQVQPIKDEPKLSEHLMHRPFAEALKDFIKKESN